jgi:hypothetical protein
MKIKDILDKYRMLEDDTMKIKSVNGNDVTIDQGGAEIKTTADALLPDAEHPGQYQMKAPDPSKMTPGATITPATSEDQGTDSAAQQYVQKLSAFMQQASQPWEKVQLQKRLDAVKNGDVPHNAQGGAITVLPPAEWEAKTDPKIIARVVGKEGMSPEYLKTHGMFDRTLDYLGFEAQSPYPSRNPGMPAAADAAAQASAPAKPVQSVMPSRNNPGLDKLQNVDPSMWGTDPNAKPVQSVMPSRNATQKEGHKDTIAQGGGDVGGDATDSFINQVRDKGYERKNRGSSGASSKSTLSEKDELYKWLTIAGLK